MFIIFFLFEKCIISDYSVFQMTCLDFFLTLTLDFVSPEIIIWQHIRIEPIVNQFPSAVNIIVAIKTVNEYYKSAFTKIEINLCCKQVFV